MSEDNAASSFNDLEDLDGHEVQEMRSSFERDGIEMQRINPCREERVSMYNVYGARPHS